MVAHLEHHHMPLVRQHVSLHGHAHHHTHDAKTDQKALKLSLGITFSVMIAEIACGLYANSLALVSDGIHMFTHAFALALSLFAMIIATKKATKEKSFGYFRAEILAALINGLSIAFSVVWIVYEAIERLATPQRILSEVTLGVAVLGLLVNIVTGWILYKADHDNLNIKSAFLHMLTDALSSVAIILGAIVIYYTQWYSLDALIALLVSLAIVRWAWSLIKDASHTLLEGSPLDTALIEKALLEHFTFIAGIEDIHCWEISHRYYCFTAHIRIKSWTKASSNDMIHTINLFLVKSFEIAHSTIQLEVETPVSFRINDKCY